jgi:hypothetical protein
VALVLTVVTGLHPITGTPEVHAASPKKRCIKAHCKGQKKLCAVQAKRAFKRAKRACGKSGRCGKAVRKVLRTNRRQCAGRFKDCKSCCKEDAAAACAMSFCGDGLLIDGEQCELGVAECAVDEVCTECACIAAPPVLPNAPPTISGTPETTIRAGTAYTFVPQAFDPDGDTLTFQIVNAPGWARFDDRTGALTGTPFTAHVGEYPGIMIRASDGTDTAHLDPFALTVLPQQLGQANFTPTGDVFPTANGYRSVGGLTLNTGERVLEFANSDLLLEFDAEGNLLDLVGETDLPTRISDNVTVPAAVRAVVGLMRGAEINADPDFGIRLMDDIDYFVFYIGASLDITIEDPDAPGGFETVTLETPAAGQIILISDPTDPFLYRFGATPLVGEFGNGTSRNGLIPFVPQLDFSGLDSFNGHEIEKGAMGLGVKIFDFFEIGGTRVTKRPQLGDIDWDDPLSSAIEYKAGINGLFDFSFSILSVGLFSFELAQGSATLDVGLDRQQMALAFRIAPDVSWVPEWFHLVPTTEGEAAGFVDGDGTYSIGIHGSYQSTVPAADVAGTMLFANSGVTLTGTTTEGEEELRVSLEFADDETVGRVEFPERYAASITTDVSAALDDEIAKVEQALETLQQATADYEFEVSLRGLRSALPAMMDAAIGTLNAIPGIVHDRAYDRAISYMKNTCVDVGLFKTCIDDVVNETSIANDIADKAESEAADGIKPHLAAMRDLQARALEADDDALRQALRTALDGAYNHRTYSKNVKVTHRFPSPFGSKTVYNETYTRTILSPSQADQLLTARDNVHRIAETSDLMISAQQIYDALPTEDVISRVKQEVDDGIAAVPIPEGLGYRAINDRYEAFVTIDGIDHDLAINVLRPSEVRAGVSDLLADVLLSTAP